MPETGTRAPGGTALQELNSLGITYSHEERPGSLEELQVVMAKASREKLRVLPLGGGTALGSGNLPEKVDILLHMTGLDKVLHFDAKNLNLSLEAGVNVQAVNTFLAEQDRGFFLPLDPWQAERATIGGTYASNSSGPWRQFYGTVRDLALGAGALDAAGHEVKFGGMTVKNVSGYDLTKFFVGSAGSLCLINRVSFRILPLPEAFSCCELLVRNSEQADSLLQSIRASLLVPSALLATGGSACPEVRILTAFEGHPKAVERQIRDLEKMGTAAGDSSQVTMGREAVRDLLGEAFNPGLAAGNRAVFKLSVPISKGARAMETLRQLAEEQHLECRLCLLAGNGLLLIHLGYEQIADLPAYVSRMRETAGELQGHVVPVQTPYEILKNWGLRGDSLVDQVILEPIKQQLDPRGILLPLNS